MLSFEINAAIVFQNLGSDKLQMQEVAVYDVIRAGQKGKKKQSDEPNSI